MDERFTNRTATAGDQRIHLVEAGEGPLVLMAHGPRSRGTRGAREYDIADSLLRKWRDQFLAAGAERLSGKAERTEVDELRAKVSKLERALGRKTMEVEVAGGLLRGWE